MKINLEDTTFLIPVRLDSIIRLENLLLTIELLQDHFKTNIHVLEASAYSSGIIRKLTDSDIQYDFIEDKDSIFHRTKYLNMMTFQVKTPFMAIWDADIIIDTNQILSSLNNLRIENVDIVFPYDGHFYDMTYIIREHYVINKDINFLKRNEPKMNLIYGDQMLGGAIIVNVEKYKYAGMENEHFYGWGQEDAERYYRWLNLDYKVSRRNGSLYHLTHPRDINGKFKSESYRIEVEDMLSLTVNKTKDEILNSKFNL